MPSKEQSIIFAEKQSFEAAHKALSVHIAQRRLQQLYKEIFEHCYKLSH